MADFVRVKDNETKHEFTVTQERYDLDPDLFTVLKKDATDPGGDPLPPKYHTTVSEQAAKSQDAPKSN